MRLSLLRPPLFHRSGKSLRIDYHCRYAAVLRKLVELLKVGTVIYKPSCFLAIILHKMVLEHTEALGHTLADGDARHYNNKLRPSVAAVELKHRLNIDVCLTGAGLHLHIEVHDAVSGSQRSTRRDLVTNLDVADVIKKLLLVKLHICIAVSGFLVFGEDMLLSRTKVAAILPGVTHGLTSKHCDGVLYGLRLVLLYLKLKFHKFRF